MQLPPKRSTRLPLLKLAAAAGTVLAAVPAIWFSLSDKMLTGPETQASASASQTVRPPDEWWDKVIQEASGSGNYETAADFMKRKAAFAKFNGDEQLAASYYAESDKLLRTEGGETAALPASAPAANSDHSAAHTTAEAAAEPVLELYGGAAVPPSGAKPLAKFEPVSGVYLGMLGADRRTGFDVSNIEPVYGRKHAIYLSYVGWRKYQTDTNSYFPFRQADRIKALGGAIQIGWEPRFGLEDVKDDEYVRTFAKEAKQSGMPVFLRYASEMNGAWVPWHDNPQLYIEKFRLVHDIMKEEAPNVVMVWSPNFLPIDTIEQYYPGDDYVDWVGFSLYATPLTGGKPDLYSNMVDHFKPLYEKYKHKPIMISEGAVGHQVLLPEEQNLPKWGESQLAVMYGYLPNMFPQVKAITYFNFSKSRAKSQKMEYVYDIGDNLRMDVLYKKLIAEPPFLSNVYAAGAADTPPPLVYTPVNKIDSASAGYKRFFTYVKLPDGSQPTAVVYSQNGKKIASSFELPWNAEIDVTKLVPDAPLVITAYNDRLEPVGKTSIPVTLAR